MKRGREDILVLEMMGDAIEEVFLVFLIFFAELWPVVLHSS